MNRKEMEYLNNDTDDFKVIRTEILFAPLLIVLPFLVGVLFIQEWFYRGFSLGVSDFDIQFIMGVIIIIGNIVFDIPFIKSLIKFEKK